MIRRLWKESAPLTGCCLVLIAVFLASAIGIFADPRTITGVPAWLKPAKFALSGVIFTSTLAWMFQYLPAWPRLKRITGWTIAIVFLLEIGLIDLQAARGTTSHFNAGTGFDAAVFSIMGVAIALLWIASAAIAYALFRQPFANRAWGWSLRLGALIYVIGAAAGGFMLGPTAEQRAALAAHEKVATIGAHTVGAPDGGPGIPGVGWSLHHGDLRIPHFFGLHALQIIPFLGWLIVRNHKSARLVFSAAASYVAFVGILAWQALRGQSILEPDPATLTAFGIWAAATLVIVIWSGKGSEQYDSGTAVLSV